MLFVVPGRYLFFDGFWFYGGMRMQRIFYISLSDGFKSWYNPVAYNSKYDEVQNTFFNFYVPCQNYPFLYSIDSTA